jgi:hypothetical protein
MGAAPEQPVTVRITKAPSDLTERPVRLFVESGHLASAVNLTVAEARDLRDRLSEVMEQE